MEERSIYISSVDREKVGISKTHDLKIKLQTTLKLDQDMKHEIAVDTVMMTYSWHNISDKYNNNKIKYSHDGGVNWEQVTLLMVCTHMKTLTIFCINTWLIKDIQKKINILSIYYSYYLHIEQSLNLRMIIN